MADSALPPIRSDAEYRAALSRIGTIFENGKVLPSDSVEWGRISALLARVDEWERSGGEAEAEESAPDVSFEPAPARKTPAMNGLPHQATQTPPLGQRARAAPDIRGPHTDPRFVSTASPGKL